MRYLKNVISADSYTWLLCLIAATLALSLALNNILIILLVIIWLLEGNWSAKWNNLKQNKWALIVIAFYALHILGLSYTTDLKAGLFDVEKKLPLLLFPLVLGSTIFSKEIAYKKVAQYFTAGCFLAAIYCLAHALFRFWNNIPTQQSVYGGFEATQAFRKQNGGTSHIWDYITYTELTLPLKIHPTYFAMYVAFISLYLILGLIQKKRVQLSFAASKTCVLLLLAFFVVFLFLLSSRIILIVFIISTITIPIVFFHRKASKLKLATAAFLFLLTLGFIASTVPVIRHRFTSDIILFTANNEHNKLPGTGMFARLQYWSAATYTLAKNPVAGVGTGDAQSALDSYYIKHNYTSAIGYNAHNQYLQTGAMLGVPGILNLFLIFVIMFWYGVRGKNMVLIYFIVLVGTVSFTEAILQINKGVVFLSLFSSLLLLTNSFRKKSGTVTESISY
ncbi:O-antigen ligase family protein [Pontibacter locisalis]|uniref:O-antigen ligase family protein n=1 Tax=Pontibacter locisalis TaxID=1719035 RepID=A0ABW5IIB8_9BACT